VDRVVIIGRGRIQAAGTPGELKTTCQASTLDEVFLASTGQELAV